MGIPAAEATRARCPGAKNFCCLTAAHWQGWQAAIVGAVAYAPRSLGNGTSGRWWFLKFLVDDALSPLIAECLQATRVLAAKCSRTVVHSTRAEYLSEPSAAADRLQRLVG